MLENRLMLVATLFCASAAFASRPDGPQPLFVDAAAPGPVHDGLTWCTAFSDLQDGLAEARRSRVAEIRIARGTYHPAPPNGDRSATFLLDGDFTLRGGHAGCAADDPDARDFIRFQTILSGDLNDDDVYGDCRDFSNCCVAHEGIGCENPGCEALICARAPVCCEPLPPQTGWAAICATHARLLCTGMLNHRRDNALRVVTAREGTNTLDGVTIVGGYSDDGWLSGWGAAISNHARLTLRNAVVRHNVTTAFGCVYSDSQSELYVEDSLFEHNTGTAVSSFWDDVRIDVSRCVFRDSPYRGSLGGANVTVRDSLFVDNEDTAFGHFSFGQHSTVVGCTFLRNGGGVNNSGGLLTVTSCDFTGNSGKSLRNTSAATLVNLCRFWSNRDTSVQNIGAFLQMEDSKVVNNSGGSNAAIAHSGGELHIINCTIADNNTTSWTAGVYAGDGTVRIKNSIIWGNRADRQQGEAAQFDAPWVLGTVTAFVDHSIIEDWTGDLGWPGNIVGVGNTAADPLFRSPLGPDGIPGTKDDDYRLAPGSPAIDAGDPAYNTASDPADLDGIPRILCGRVDIGAYEFGLGDFNCDRTADLADFAAFPGCQTGPVGAPLAPGCEAFDANADQRIDLADFARLQRFLTAP